MLNIEIDDINTWPSGIQDLLEAKFQVLSSHAAWENEYPFLPLPERHYATNPYSGERYLVIQQINEMVRGHNLIGYHCTRLLDSEISSIKSDGLEPLSGDLVRRRMMRAISESVLSNEEALKFLSENQCTEKNRQGMIWFVCGISVLKKESLVVRLLRSWGGEAVYNLHNDDCILSTIGKPCIVRSSLIQSQLKLGINCLAEKIIDAFLQNCGVTTPNNPQFDTYVTQQLLPGQILKIIERDDPEFEELTNYVGWIKKI